MQTQVWAYGNHGTTGVVHTFTQQVLTEAAALPLIMSANDFSGRLLAPVMALPRRPLSNSESTASCNIRFHCADDDVRRMQFQQTFQTVVTVDDATGINRSNPEVAKRPPSNGTNGRKSGWGHRQHIHNHPPSFIPERWKASNTFKRLAIFLILVSEPVDSSS